LTAAETFGFGASLGWGYRAQPTPLLVGWGGRDPLTDLALTAGVWFEWQRHCHSVEQALQGMRLHLTRERTPLIAALEPLEPVASLAGAPLRGAKSAAFVCVHGMDDDALRVSSNVDEVRTSIPLAEFRERLQGHEGDWCVVFSNGRFMPTRSMLRTALYRAWHRLQSGWRNAASGIDAMLEALLRAQPTVSPARLEETCLASAALGGGFGRPLFADFLRHHAEELGPHAEPAVSHYRQLGQAWRECEQQLCTQGVGERELVELAQLEHQGLSLLAELCHPWRGKALQ
jgi:hypothetical protein